MMIMIIICKYLFAYQVYVVFLKSTAINSGLAFVFNNLDLFLRICQLNGKQKQKFVMSVVCLSVRMFLAIFFQNCQNYTVETCFLSIL